jgi:hypothetical protein
MCGIDICPVHTRTDVVDPVEANVPARAVQYHGEYAVATLDNPAYGNPLAALGSLLDPNYEPPNMFITMVVKVGEGSLGDVLAEGSGELEKATVFKETFLSPNDPRLEEFLDLNPFSSDTSKFNERLTEIMHASHEMVMSSVKEGLIPS